MGMGISYERGTRPAEREDAVPQSGGVQGYLDYKKPPPPLGPP